MPTTNKGRIIGIDLGTSNSCGAVILGRRVKIIHAPEGHLPYGKAVPSVVAYSSDGTPIVGIGALQQIGVKGFEVVTRIKRLMGTNDIVAVNGRHYRPPEIASQILRKIKHDAEQLLSIEIKRAIITVPAYFNDSQIQATKDAGKLAGLEVVRLVHEPAAAAIAYGYDAGPENSIIMVFDLGGGTLDVTIMQKHGKSFEVRGIAGDNYLGGSNMDDLITNYILDQFMGKEGVDLKNAEESKEKAEAMARLRQVVELAKISLSNEKLSTAEVKVPYFYPNSAGRPVTLDQVLTRTTLNQLIEPLLENCSKVIDDALASSKIGKSEVSRIIMVGGPTRMPAVREFIKRKMGLEPYSALDPMEAVVSGAAILGAYLNGEIDEPIVLLDRTPIAYGVAMRDNQFGEVIPKNTLLPNESKQIFSTAHDNQTSADVIVLQGNDRDARKNEVVGRTILHGIEPQPKGIPQIEVTFTLDENRILNVRAKDLGTNNEVEITQIRTLIQDYFHSDRKRDNDRTRNFSEDDEWFSKDD